MLYRICVCVRQLKVKDVHIRYEDSATCGSAFACGLTVASLAAESCDSEWRRGFTLLPPDGCSFKLIELHQLAVYWDPLSVPSGIFADCNIAELTVSDRIMFICTYLPTRWLHRG